jgi:hypothetical protein
MSKQRRWPLWIIAGVAAAVGVYLLVQGSLATRVAKLVADSGERQLRDPLRPIRGAPRVLLFALDGVGQDELLSVVTSGRTPHLGALLGAPLGEGLFAHGYAARDVLSVLPSTTLAAWASVFTGEPPARTGIPGNEFFVREHLRYVAPAPVSADGHQDVARVFNDDLMGGYLHVPTLYELADVRAHVALSHFYRGADLLTLPDVTSFAKMAATAAAGLIEDEDPEVHPYSELDGQAVEVALEVMARHGIPDLQVIYFPGVDLYTHMAQRPLTRQREYVADVLDTAIGKVLEAYRAADALDDTFVLLVSDHGHTPVLEADQHALGAEGEDEPTALIERAGYRLRDNALEIDPASDFQAAVAYQGAFAYVYLADRSSCPEPGTPCDWQRPPRLEQDVLPLVRAFDQANREGALVPALQGTLDLILSRTPRPTSEDALPFEVWEDDRLVPVGQWLERNPRPELPDLERRLRGLGAGPYGHRAGDVLLLANAGAARPIEERYYFSDRYRSWHGSPEWQDSRIVLVLAGGGRAGPQLRELLHDVTGANPTQLDVTRLILALLRG